MPRSPLRSADKPISTAEIADRSAPAGRLPLPAGRPVWALVKRGGFLMLAGVFFLLGALGAILPGLPATPFLLLTSYFLLKSWPRANRALLRSRLFGGVLRDWQEHRGIRRHVKVKSAALVVLVLAGSIYLVDYSLPMLALVVLSALVGMVIVLKLPEVP